MSNILNVPNIASRPEPSIEPSIAKEVCKTCAAGDCSIRVQRGEETTMGWHGPEYDKDGNRTDRGNPNRQDFHVRCDHCGSKWTVRAKYEQIVRVAAHSASQAPR